MKRSGNISFYKCVLLFFLCVLFPNPLIFALSFVFTYRIGLKNMLLLALLFLLLVPLRYLRRDLVPIGIVDYREGSRYIVDKGLYKTVLYTEEKLSAGDVLLIRKSFPADSLSLQKKNVVYAAEEAELLFRFPVRSFIEKRIDSFSSKTSSLLKKVLYGVDDHSFEDLGVLYSFGFYYLIRMIRRKAPLHSFILTVMYHLFVCSQLKILLLYADLLLDKTSLDQKDRLACKALFFYYLNDKLLMSYSLILPLLYGALSFIETGINRNVLLMFLQSFLFSEIRIFSFLVLRYIRIITVSLFIGSVILLMLPGLEWPFLKLCELVSMLQGMADLSIRGKLSILSLLLWLLAVFLFRLKNAYVQMALIIILLISPLNRPFAKVVFIDVGQGDAILIRDHLNRGNVLIDTGSPFNYSKLKRRLYAEGIVTIDHLILTHDDADHNGNKEILQKDFRIRDVVETGRDLQAGSLYLHYYDLGLHSNDNDNSLIYSLCIGETDFLFTGDISKSVERELMERYGPEIDILKVSHHGSYTGTSEYLISRALPELAVISTSGQYHHPHANTLSTLHKYRIPYLTTKDEGDIAILFAGRFRIRESGGEFAIME